jgi:hypothetical protein
MIQPGGQAQFRSALQCRGSLERARSKLASIAIAIALPCCCTHRWRLGALATSRIWSDNRTVRNPRAAATRAYPCFGFFCQLLVRSHANSRSFMNTRAISYQLETHTVLYQTSMRVPRPIHKSRWMRWRTRMTHFPRSGRASSPFRVFHLYHAYSIPYFQTISPQID